MSDYEYNKSLGFSGTDALTLAHTKEATEKRLAANQATPQYHGSKGGGGFDEFMGKIMVWGIVGIAFVFGISVVVWIIMTAASPYVWTYEYVTHGEGFERIFFAAIFSASSAVTFLLCLGLTRKFSGKYEAYAVAFLLLPVANLGVCALGFLAIDSSSILTNVENIILHSSIFENAVSESSQVISNFPYELPMQSSLIDMPNFILSGGIGWFFVGLGYAALWCFFRTVKMLKAS